MPDKSIKCVDCQQHFTWTEEEQAFYREKRFTEPKRCKPCRDRKKQEREGHRR